MKVMICNAYGRSNRGDSVLLDECIAEIKSALPSAKIGCAVFEGIENSRAAHPDVKWTERIGNANGQGKIAKLVTAWLLVVAALASLPGLASLARLLPDKQRQSWDLIREADVVVSAPGGYLHDTNFAYYVALLHIFLGRRATRNVLAPQSVGPIDAPLARKFARWILSRCDAICARESYSWNFLTKDLKLPEAILRRSGDSAFWNHEIIDPRHPIVAQAWEEIGLDPQKGDKILGLTVVDWNFPKSSNPDRARDNYIRGLSEVIDHMHDRHGMRTVIFNQVSDDIGMASRVAESCNCKVYLDRTSREPDILRALLAQSTLFLGTRFHSCIFAMMASLPTFAIAYLPKTSYILKDLTLEERQISISQFSSSTVISALEADLNDLSFARQRTETAVEEYRRTHARLRDVLEETQ